MQLHGVLVVHAHLHFQFRVVESQAEVLQLDILETQGVTDQKGELTERLVFFDSHLGQF